MPPRNDHLETLAALRNIQLQLADLAKQIELLAAELRHRDALDAQFRAGLRDLVAQLRTHPTGDHDVHATAGTNADP